MIGSGQEYHMQRGTRHLGISDPIGYTESTDLLLPAPILNLIWFTVKYFPAEFGT